MHRKHSILSCMTVLAALACQVSMPSRVIAQAAGSEPDLLQQVRKRQELADIKAIGEALVALTGALVARPWYPPLADRLIASAQVNVFTDLDASCECKQQLFTILGWFLPK